MAKQGNLNNQDVYKQGIYAREELSTTGIGEGIAIPHAQSEAVNAPGLAAMVVKDGVDYQSLDNQPAKLFFMIAVPKTGGNEHLQILAMLSQMLMDTDFKYSLINAQSVEEFMDLINQKEATQKAKEEEKEAAQKEFTGTYRLLAVTACPTGIAHTYMAAEALEEKAKQMGITIKVETDGSGGTKNAPTTKEIEECEAIIVAADKNVEMARSNGKPVIQVKVADGINKAAYVFGTASIASGNYDIMAAVMIGGMVPPLAIALATFFFKNRFTKKEQQTTLTNVIMGLSFITEGAIPFAASDPFHILPACVAGSAVAGALSMFFNCTLMAPHGGIFVIGVISNPLGYLFALAIG